LLDKPKLIQSSGIWHPPCKSSVQPLEKHQEHFAAPGCALALGERVVPPEFSRPEATYDGLPMKINIRSFRSRPTNREPWTRLRLLHNRLQTFGLLIARKVSTPAAL